MKPIQFSLYMSLIYIIAFICIGWLIFTFLYQYILAIGSWRELLSSMNNNRMLSALFLSIASSCVTVFLSIFLGVAAAYFFAMKKFPGQSFVEVISVDVPQTFPPVSEGMIYLLMLGPKSIFHINAAFTFTALVIAKLYVCMPFVISLTARKFREIKSSGLHTTARSLGANQFQVFRMIFLPLASKDILAGSTLCWARAMGEFGGSLIFAGVIAYQTETIPAFIMNQSQVAPTVALAATILATTASTLSLIAFKTMTRE